MHPHKNASSLKKGEDRLDCAYIRHERAKKGHSLLATGARSKRKGPKKSCISLRMPSLMHKTVVHE